MNETNFSTTPEERLGDKIEFMDTYGLWHDRKLCKDNFGFFVSFNGERVPVKQHHMFSLGNSFRRDEDSERMVQ